MNENSEKFKKLYQEELKQFVLPERLRGQYEIVKCLKSAEESWTVLVRQQLTGILCVVKKGSGIYGELLKREYEVLKELDRTGLRGIPKPYCFLEEKENRYFMREYVEGKSLYEIAQERDFPVKELRRIGVELCEIVGQMHELEIPMLHRDIKPENVVLMESGRCVLVDFGTARYYRKDEARDTLILGTAGTAAPEQYGYAQTDVRTDVYAIGRTLCYLFTGSYTLEGLKGFGKNRRFCRILKKASSFDPEKRYDSVDKMKKALQSCGKHPCSGRTGAVTFLIALGAGIWIGGYGGKAAERIFETERTSEEESQTAQKIVFQEPLVEAAVRRSLGVSEETVLTEEMLEKVTLLQIAGNRILEPADQVEVRNGLYVNGELQDEYERGSITDLADLMYLKNLKTLVLCRQKLQKASYLENLPLERLYLYDNDITDLSPLGGQVRLRELAVGKNPCTDLSALGECIRLENLNLDNMEIKNLDFMKVLDLEKLSLLETRIAEGGIEKLSSQENLQELRKNNLKKEDIVTLKQLKRLHRLLCYSGYEMENLEGLEGMDSLDFLVLMRGLKSLDGIGKLPSLKYLHIQGSEVADLAPITGAPGLLHLGIQNLPIEDYAPVAYHPALEEVFCDSRQVKEIQKENPETKLVFSVANE